MYAHRLVLRVSTLVLHCIGFMMSRCESLCVTYLTVQEEDREDTPPVNYQVGTTGNIPPLSDDNDLDDIDDTRSEIEFSASIDVTEQVSHL